LIEIPLLIRNHSGELPTPSLPAGSIEVKLGDGAWLRPNFVRQEGQDPIELAILLDLNSPVNDLPRPLTQALSSLKSLSLTSRDHVSLFVMDCASVRVTSVPADPAQVSNAVTSAISPPGQSGKQTCKEGGRLWDTLAVMTRTLQQSPSRRVILAITEGKDHGSVITEKDLADRAQDSAVAIFQLDPAENSALGPQFSVVNHGLPLIVQSSGGLTLGEGPSSLRQQIQRVVTFLRGRYIVQLHLPADAKPGHVLLSARVTELTSQTYTVRITGNSAPLPNPAEAVEAPAEVAKADAAPQQPIQATAATVTQPAPAPAVSAPVAVDQSQPAQQPATPSPLQPSGEATTVRAEAQGSNRAVAATQVPSLPVSTSTSVPTLKVNTRLTLVDVTVTDSKGRPVHGLTQADFTVKEDGKPQPIKDFEELGKDRPEIAVAAPALPPDTYSNQQAPRPTTEAVNILLFDQVSTGISRGLVPSPETLRLFKEAADGYVKTMPAGTQVAVMTTDGSGLHLLQGFTTDRNLLIAAVNSIPSQLVPDARWDPAPGGAGPPPCPAMNFQSAEALNSLNQVALYVAGSPGRKNLMLFTPGIPWLTDYPYFAGIGCFLIDYTEQLQQVYGRLTAARVALYPIDPRGLYNNPAGEATRGGRPVNNPIGFSNSVNEDIKTLEDFAKATGGKAHYSNNGMEDFLSDDISAGSDYYALSYVPPLSKYDGKYHTIEVKVDKPGVQLEYRRGYTSLDVNGPLLEQDKGLGAPAPPKNAFEAAMSYGAPAMTDLAFTVKAVPSTAPRKPDDQPVIGSLNPELKGKPLVRYSFAFDLPRDKITLEAQPDGSRKASFELAVAAYDVQGRVLNSLDEKRSLTLTADAVTGFLQKQFVVPVEIDLPAGSLSVRAGVEDLPSQQMGVVEIPLSVAK
jgi:VWFA-related protein